MRELITKALHISGESWSDVEAHTLTDAQLASDCAESFTLWTKNRVYFPTIEDLSHDVDSVPRNPCEERSGPVGNVRVL